MKAAIREHIQQLDVSQGGGIVSDKIRVDTIDNPMLVIGLGGTGIDALLRLKYQINRRFKLPEDSISKKRKEKPDNVEFIAFETNEHDRHKKYKGIGLDPLSEFVLLSNSEIGGLLQDRTTLESYITDWLSPELLITDGISGASGIRQAGRLLLFTKITQVVQALEKKIQGLSLGTNKKLMVFMLTGISGGTGSGCFLDISYIVRAIMEREYGAAGVDKVNMLGYIFMPDVNLANKSLTDHTKEYIKKNGYAALKELDYWMNVDERNERFKQRYGNAITVNSPMPPFNLAHLISATNIDGKLLENSYDYCMNVTAENITNFMASEDKQSGEEFAIHDYISNIRTNINQMPRPFTANYKYNIIGASSAVLPIEEITTFLAYRLFKKMEKMFDSTPNQEDVATLMRKIGVDMDAVTREFESRVPEAIPGYQNNDHFSYDNVIKGQIINVDTELEHSYLSRAREQYVKTKKQYPAQLLENFNEQLDRIFQNPSQGPFFASRIILTNKGYCIINQIKSYIESLQAQLARIPQDIDQARNISNQKFGDARSALISKPKKKDAFIEAKIQEYLLLADEARMEQMIEFYEDMITAINSQNSRIYEIFTELLNALNTIFENNGQILLNGDEQVDHKGNKTYYWNIVNVPDVEKIVGNIIDDKGVEELIRDFTSSLLSQSHQWIKEDEIDVIGSISEFLTDQFGDLITKSMEDFLSIKYGKDESIDNIVERIIAKKLDEEAVPVFHLSNSSGHFNFPQWGFVSVPADAANIFKGIKKYQDIAIGQARYTIKESQVKNRIFWLNTRNGIPLFSYTPIRQYEESYERTILDQEGIGRHLVQTQQKNWAFLPSPIPEKSWGEIYENRRLRQYNRDIRELFDKAIQFGCIKEKADTEATTNRYKTFFTVPFNANEIFAKHSLNLNSGTINFTQLNSCLQELKGLLENGLEMVESKDIFGSINADFAKENLIRTPDIIERLRQEVLKYEQIKVQISELEEISNKHSNDRKQLDLFIEVLYTQSIYKRGAQYVYDHDVNEDSWESIVNLMQVNKFVEYEIFKFVNALDDKRRSLLMNKAAKRSRVLTADADITPLLTRLRDLLGSASESKEALDYDRHELADGEAIYSFYKQIFDKVNNMLKTLE
ncbi:MAG: tubulin-like doman-containing protein [Candidatus Pristimantibacillus lignocellulolyticus]|uniref:Tubulin-like doman-containing protein n=1 Tax=Candidatus Pristimantibacillus lignocellulolyticus TaxID=2994561 RepID=A0A9J6ZJM7_9BACL|nr:MAG: tubulin-like doman-containing protein [Candidatus Pristimantibacillus lignocellulolyticus]